MVHGDYIGLPTQIRVLQMIVEPEQRVPDFIKAGADIVSVHCEQTATIHLHRTINEVSSILLMQHTYRY